MQKFDNPRFWVHVNIYWICYEFECVLNDIYRFWDLAYPERSYIVAGGANDSLHCPSVFYNRKIIEGTEVVQVWSSFLSYFWFLHAYILLIFTRTSLQPHQEIHSKQKSGSTEDTPRRGPESLPVGHHDIITDIATFQTTQGFIVTSSRDGIVKVWKWKTHCAKVGWHCLYGSPIKCNVNLNIMPINIIQSFRIKSTLKMKCNYIKQCNPAVCVWTVCFVFLFFCATASCDIKVI